jgi:hypothetical protein
MFALQSLRTRFGDSYGAAGDHDAGAISRSRETSAPLWLSSEELPHRRTVVGCRNGRCASHHKKDESQPPTPFRTLTASTGRNGHAHKSGQSL